MKYNYPEHYANDFRSALKLAEELKESGEYDLFRGQRHTFPIQPSAHRDGVDIKEVNQRLKKFAEWVHQTPDLNSLHDNENSIIAVAQHYGLKTPFLDFSYSPKIAGFFATDGGIQGDTGTIICVNKIRFLNSWNDMNQRRYEKEGHILTDIIEIDVKNLWRLQAQEGAFLRCHVDPSYLEMFSCFLHIYFPQNPSLEILDKEKIYPSSKSHLEVLLDQYFLIEGYPERDKNMQKIFVHKIHIGREDSTKKEISSFFSQNKIPDMHESWLSEFAETWAKEPNERYFSSTSFVEVEISLPDFNNKDDLGNYIFKQLKKVISGRDEFTRSHIKWNIQSEDRMQLYVDGEGGISKKKDEFTEFTVAEMVNSIYSGMRYLPYSNNQISRTIARYITIISFRLYDVFSDPEGIEILGRKVRGRGFCSKQRILNALRPDFYKLIKKERLNDSGKMDFRDTLYCARYIKSAYTFEKFINLMSEDIIPSTAATPIEGLVINTNPYYLDIIGES
ncbi:FRG domain-containing protein [Ulvibacterium sp.]|uniref:FRG domain-containing protein n=1 Tax=Ulvibacterium sp. TaxID=2665914 RepID=UPI003BADBCB6